jgi:predicted CopG family antitoxin
MNATNRKEKRTLMQRGFRQIVVSLEVYNELLRLKGDKSFAQFISELIDNPKMST